MDTEVLRAERTLLPLGAVCVLDVPGDRVGPQTVRVQSWPDTIVWLGAGAASLAGLGLLVLPAAWLRAMRRLLRTRVARDADGPGALPCDRSR